VSRPTHPTKTGRPHLAAFILPSLGRRSAPRRSCAALRQIAIGQKTRPSTQAADSALVRCSRYAESFVTAPASRVAQIERSQDAGAAAAVPVVCRSGAGRRQADGFRSDEVMSGVVDSGRESGHGNIDANDPQRASQPNADLPELGSELLSKGPLTFGGDHHSARSIDAPNPLLLEAVGTYGRPDCSR
jgi:hypothetical protein